MLVEFEVKLNQMGWSNFTSLSLRAELVLTIWLMIQIELEPSLVVFHIPNPQSDVLVEFHIANPMSKKSDVLVEFHIPNPQEHVHVHHELPLQASPYIILFFHCRQHKVDNLCIDFLDLN